MFDDSISISLTISASRFARAAVLASFSEVSSTTWRVTSMLNWYGAMRPSEIANRERTSRATTTKILQRLEREGVIRRSIDSEDGRSYLVELTEQGKANLLLWQSNLAEALAPKMEMLTKAQIQTLVEAEKILRDITTQLEEK